MKARRNRPLFLIDLSVPRNIDPAVGGLDNVSLHDIDDLEKIAQRGVHTRKRALAACSEIIEEHIAAVTEKLDAEDELRHQDCLPREFSTASGLLLRVA